MIVDHVAVTAAQISTRQADIDKLDTSLFGALSKGHTLEWTTHTFPTGKTQTFLDIHDADGNRVRPLGKKGAGSRLFTLSPGKVTMARLTPAGAGHFADLEKKTGRYRYAIGLASPSGEDYDEEVLANFKVCYEALTEAFNTKLPEHFAKGKNTEGIAITSCLPVIKEKWEEFKRRHGDAAKKAAERDALKRATKELIQKYTDDGLSVEDAKKKAEKMAKKRVTKDAAAGAEIDETDLRQDFADELIAKMSDPDNKFLREKNMSIFNAEVLTLNFDMRSNPKIPRVMSEEDRAYLDAWKSIFSEGDENLDHLDAIETQYNKALEGKNPLTLNRDEFTITDSDGKPMTIQDAYKYVNWRNALATMTIRTRSIDFKNIDGMQCVTYIDMVSLQVEVNGTKGEEQRPVGSSVSIFASNPAKRSASEMAEPTEAKKIKSSDLEETD